MFGTQRSFDDVFTRRARRSLASLGNQRARRRPRRIAAIELLEGRTLLTTYTVSSAGTGNVAGTLLYEINQLNSTGGSSNIINFSLGSGVQTINVASPGLPTITKPVTIEGTVSGGVPQVQILGGSAGSGASGLTFGSGSAGSSVQDLVIGGFGFYGIVISSTGDSVLGCWVGINASGSADPNEYGIYVGGSGTMIGGTKTGDANVISGNSQSGVNIQGSCVVEGNFIGTNAAGTAAVANDVGIGVGGGGTATITIGPGNVISGNTDDGVSIAGSCLILGNDIGTNAAGTAAVANGTGILVGIEVWPGCATIGGTTTGTGNVISGNSGDGINSAGPCLVEGNEIGTNAAGTTAVANGDDGISVSGYSATIGGTTTGAGNSISDNSQAGIDVTSGASATITDDAITDDSTGILVGSTASDTCQVTAQDDNLSGNTTAGIDNIEYSPAYAVTATDDWWGSLHGPTTTANPGGSGSNVSSNVSFTPWIGAYSAGTGPGFHPTGITLYAVPTRLVFVTEPSLTATPGVALATQPVIEAEDASGNLGINFDTTTVPDSQAVMTLNTLSGTGTLAGTASVSPSGGFAGFNGLSVTGDGTFTLTASASGFGSLNLSGASSQIQVSAPSTVVTSTADSGPGTLRAVITAVDSGAAPSFITFDLGSSGPQTITLASPLPAITVPVDIAGNTEPGFSGVPLVVISGASAGIGANGLTLASGSSSSTIEGLVVNGFSGDGIDIASTNDVVIGCYIGTNAAGTAAVPNGTGIYIGGAGATIGGTATGAGNSISDNSLAGVYVDSGATATITGDAITGNAIGILVGRGASDTCLVTAQYDNLTGNTTAGITNNQTNAVYAVTATDDWWGSLHGPTTTANPGGNGIGISSNVSFTPWIGAYTSSAGVGFQPTGITLYAVPTHLVFVAEPSSAAGPGVAFTTQPVVEAEDASGNLGINFDAATVPGAQAMMTLNTISGAGTLGEGTSVIPSGGFASFNGLNISAIGTYTLTASALGFGSLGVGGTSSQIQVIIPTSYTVTSTADSGPGTLRAAITAVDSAGAPSSTITFDLGSSGPQTIALASSLPAITAPVYIQGNTEPGFSGVPLVVISGASAGSNYNGLTLASGSSGSTIEGLVVNGFGTGDGIDIASTNDSVIGCYIGTNAAGTAAVANEYDIYVNASGATIGGTTSGAGNIISGGYYAGVYIAASCLIEGNYIGTNAAGTAAVANNFGIYVNAPGATIGGTTTGAGNVISGNTVTSSTPEEVGGVYVNAACLIEGNEIGTNAAGTAAVANEFGIGVFAANTTIGGTAAGAGNVISGSIYDGVLITAASCLVEGNEIGTNAAGTAAVPNGTGSKNGVVTNAGVEVDALGATIGGTSSGAGNVISGNKYDGLFMGAPSGLVEGNEIGTNAAGTAAVANGYGIGVSASAATIGGTTAGAGNTISDNTNAGIDVTSGATATITDDSIMSDGTGILVGSGASDTSHVTAQYDNLSGNTTAGITNNQTNPSYAVTATYDWWGSLLGPTTPANPCGNGASVSANVNFSPWIGVQLVANGGTENLQWYGTSGSDQVQFIQTAAGTVQINLSELAGIATSATATVTGVTGSVVADEYDVAGDTDVVDASGLTTIPSVITVGNGNDTIIGGGGANTIVAGNGANTIYGNGIGNSPNASGIQDPSNNISVGSGNNIIYGNYSGSGYQGGNNTITAGGGNNTIYGNYGEGGRQNFASGVPFFDGAEGSNNTITVGDGNNTIYGNYGNADGGEGGSNTIVAGNGNNIIYGNAAGNDPNRLNGSNFIQVGNGTNTIYGNLGGDGGEGGNNTIVTGSGTDTIYGNFGGDGGEGGNNLIVAGGGNDTIYAHCALPATSSTSGTTAEGRDLIIGGTGADTVFGWPAGYTLGSNTGDLFVAGTTNLSLSALDAVLAEWASSDSYATRVADLSGANGTVGANGSNYLISDTTVFGSAAVDEIFGKVGSDDDWYLVTSNDQLNNVNPSEVTQIPVAQS